MGEKKWLDATGEKIVSMKGSNPPPPDISRKPAPPPSPPSLDRRRSSQARAARIDRLRDVYQRVQARDADHDAALQDIQDAVLVLLEEHTNTIFNGG